MNKIYKSLWSRALGAWVAVPETARSRTGASTAGAVVGASITPVWRKHCLAIAMAAVWGGLTVAPAYAACTQPDATVLIVECADVTVEGFTDSRNNLTVMVLPGASMEPGISGTKAAIHLTGTGVSLNNRGRIGSESVASSGVVISNAAGSTVNVQNNVVGGITAASSSAGEHTALQIRNGAGGVTRVDNFGSIRSLSVSGSATAAEDQIAISLGGGAKNSVYNTGTIEGRVELHASTEGNIFTNAGSINGSVSLGAGGGANRFEALTGSSMTSNGVFLVDGGSANNGNTLALNNTLGSGTVGSGTIDASKYRNFSKLDVSSGKWTVSGIDTMAGLEAINVNGVLIGGSLQVRSGVTLAGAGTVQAKITVADGGRLEGRSHKTLSIDSLTLSSDSVINVTLDSPTTADGPIFAVSQDLTLDGTLNITDASNLRNGVYQLFTNGGWLVNNGLNLGVLPNGWQAEELTLQASIAGQVNLVVKAANQDIQYWDGSNTAPNGFVEGGSGVWNSGSTNWTSADGGLNHLWLAGFSVFQGNSGTVSVEGTQSINGMDFKTDGYTLVAGAEGKLSLVDNRMGLKAAIRVATDVTAVIEAPMSGNRGVEKLDPGTLVLSGDNSYAGGTTLSGGSLLVGHANALGLGKLTTENGTTLGASGGSQTVSNQVDLKGALTIKGNNSLTLNGVISGTGSLVKNDAAQLTLSGSNTHVGGIALNAGTLVLGNSSAVGTGTLTAAAGTMLDSSVDVVLGSKVVLQGELSVLGSNALTLGGDMSGNGSLSKLGTATLTLTGNNTYTGTTTVANGSLYLAATSSLDSSSVAVEQGATLAGLGELKGRVTIKDGATLKPGMPNSGQLCSGGGLTVNNLTMQSGSKLKVTLGAPGPDFLTLGQSTSVRVKGDIALSDVLLDVDEATGFGAGVYRLFDYDGGLILSNGGIKVVHPDMTVQFLSAQKKINVINSAGLTLNFWNANGLATSTQFGGGTGEWSQTIANWADAQGQVTGPMKPQPDFAIFGGTAGTVSVNNTDGAVEATGMQFASDGYVMDGDALTLVAGNTSSSPVEIRVGDGSASSSGWTAKINNELAGSHGLDKTGAGTLLLTAVNSYSGGTTVSAGTLSVAQDTSLGQSGESVTLNGGRLQITGTGFTSNGSRTWVLGAAGGMVDIADSANTFTVDSNLSGSGVFAKGGDGTLQLSGANTYSGGTVIEGGRLIASVANLGSGAIRTNAELELAQASNATLSQTVEGSGSVIKTGAGQLNLMGHNTWSGGLQINDGSVAASVASLGSGDILNNANLTLQQNTDATLAQAISGTGSMHKIGGGVLTLAGNSRNFSGNTRVAAGTLLVAQKASLGGAVTVATGATLAGTGSVGSVGSLTTVASGATIKPSDNGVDYGTMNIAGDLLLEQGATYYVQADPESDSSSLLKVAGKATLGGSVLHAGTELNAKTDFKVGKTYTILEASSLQGTFGAVKSNYAYLDAALGYRANAVDLTLKRKSEDGGTTTIDFADLAQTGNQVATANGIESLASNHPLYEFVETLPAGAPPAVFDSLSGEAHASVASGLASVGSLASSLGSQHLYQNLTAGRRAGEPIAQNDGALPASAWPSSKALPAWAEVIGHWQRFDGDNNVGQMKQRTTGVFLGMDEKLGGSDWRVGAAVGYIHAKTDVDDRSSNTKVDNYSVAIYAGRSMEAGANHINMLGGLAYTWHDIRTERNVSSLDQKLKADYRAHTAQAFAEVGYAIGQYDQVGVEPFVGMSVAEQRIRGFSEKGGFAALEGKSSNNTLASSTLGVRLHSNVQVGEQEGRLRATLGWRHAIGSVTSERTMAFEGGQNFTVAGVPLARDTALIELGAEVSLSRYSSLGVGYKGELGNGQRDHSAQVQVRVAF